MTKRLLSLGGFAILAVVLHHAAGYGQIALFLWADRYHPVSVPYWDPLGSLPHYVLLVVRSIGVFAVPSFLFISGFFSAYMARTKRSTYQQWKAVFEKVLNLVIPYVLWSIVIFGADALQGTIYKPIDYVVKLLTKGASGHLYFVPLLCACYFVSPWISTAAKRKPLLLLFVCTLLQMGGLVVEYLHRFGIESVILTWIHRIAPSSSITWWILYFALGSVVALNLQKTKDFLAHYRWQIIITTIVTWFLNILEADHLLQAYRTNWAAGIDTVSYNLFAISVLACFLAFEDVKIPWQKAFDKLGRRSYGIYLMHILIIDVTARIIRRVIPWMLEYQIVLVPLLFVAGLGIPLLTMEFVRRWPSTRKAYRYLFG